MRTHLTSNTLLLIAALVAYAAMVPAAQAQTAKKPNILVIWGDDIGTVNISYYNRGMMIELNGRTYKNYIDGANQLDYINGKSAESPRPSFMDVNDDGQIVAMRYNDWKAVFLENRGEAFEVWREPFTELRVPLLFNLRRDPFEKAQHNSNTYNDWFLDRVYILAPMQRVAGQFLMTMKDYPPSQTPGSFNLEGIQKKIQATMGGR